MSEHLRRITDEERALLEEAAAVHERAAGVGVTLLEAFFALFFAGGPLAALALAIAWVWHTAVSFLAGESPATALASTIGTYAIWSLALGAIGWLTVWLAVSSWKSETRNAAKLREDLAEGLIRDERLTVTGVKRFKDPEHGAKIYLLRVADGRVRAIHDLAGSSLAEGGDCKALGPQIRDEMRIVTFPRSGLVLNSFEGEKPKLPRFVEMWSKPEEWPEGDSWCNLPWETVEEVLGGSAPARRKPRR